MIYSREVTSDAIDVKKMYKEKGTTDSFVGVKNFKKMAT